MEKVLKIWLMVAVMTFTGLGVLVIIGIKIPNVEEVFLRTAMVLALLVVSSLVIAFFAKPNQRVEED